MDVVEVIKLIADVGFTVVAAGVFIFLAIRMFKKQETWLNDFIKNTHVTNHPDSKGIAAIEIVNNKIYQEMRGLLNALNADRAYVVLHHNGGVSTSGLFFQKMSCICEVVGQGILPLANDCQQLHRTSYSLLCDELNNYGEALLPDTSSLQGKDNFLYQELLRRRAKSAYYRVLKDSNSQTIGFIGIDYCTQNNSFSNQQISKLMKTVGNKVSSLVDVRDEVK